MNRIRHLIPIVLFSSIAATPAIAEESRASAFADLDLSTPAGVATLDRRLEGAVRRICGDYSPNSPASREEVLRCRSETASQRLFPALRRDCVGANQGDPAQLTLTEGDRIHWPHGVWRPAPGRRTSRSEGAEQ